MLSATKTAKPFQGKKKQPIPANPKLDDIIIKVS